MKIAAASGSAIESGITNAIAAGTTAYSAYPPNAIAGIPRPPPADPLVGARAAALDRAVDLHARDVGHRVGTVLYRPWMPSRSLKLSVTASTPGRAARRRPARHVDVVEREHVGWRAVLVTRQAFMHRRCRVRRARRAVRVPARAAAGESAPRNRAVRT